MANCRSPWLNGSSRAPNFDVVRRTPARRVVDHDGAGVHEARSPLAGGRPARREDRDVEPRWVRELFDGGLERQVADAGFVIEKVRTDLPMTQLILARKV